ncbi:hypothetical protein DAY19_02940 [Halobacteriovorax vibrionivorans]|uniref:Uncharacterized protein n=1 Tax=Halobacteriovorax vibrionivorans TaxID=2152716 RepID=A0ABY0IIF7_9BACT|nr:MULTISPECIES: hypothetical protein [Halobacteriovorax]RZF22746.1 hypothetical protein DAY19_02940 [Halobacteriovorax vibrionivorans]TGD46182.1 hypothetical protein EP118_12955 [Halobacteriovorax sp. Y22]
MLKINKLIILAIWATMNIDALAQSAGYTAPTQEDVRTGNLTDQDKMKMENFTHAGYQKREAEEAWAEECGTDAYCDNIKNGGDATEGEKFLGMSPQLFKAVAQAYSMIMPAISQAGGGGTFGKIDRTTKKDVTKTWSERGVTKKDGSFQVTDEDKFKEWNNSNENPVDKDAATKQANTEESKAKEEEGADYCQYIPMGTEIIARATQKRSDEFALASQPDIENAQSAALFKQARSHRDRQKSVDIQRKGWGATTVCYTASIAMMGGSFTSPTNVLKLAASALMTKYYMWEYGMHGDAADKLNSVGKKLSGKGKCNPVSDRDCYCSQPETQNDVTYCYPQIAQRKAQNGNYQVSCVDNNVKEDVGCSCRQTNTCLDTRISAKINDMYIPGGLGSSLDNFYKMTNGVSKPEGASDSYRATAGKIFAMANDKVRDALDKVELPSSYEKKNEEVANALRDFGLNGTVANAMSAAPETKESKKAEQTLRKRYGSGLKYKGKYASYKKKDNGLYFKGGNGLNKKKKSDKKVVNPYAHLLKKKKKKNARATADILDYSIKAQKNAGITKDKSRNIFEIISRRYRYSATKKLGIQ